MTKMPEFKSEMQFPSYLPVCSATKDLPASGSNRPLLDNDQVQTSGHSRTSHHNDQLQIAGDGYNNLYPPSNASQLQDHEKEMIRNIMLEQEATFKHQLSELHRVHGRQRELMDEIRMKRLTTNNIEGKTSKTNPIMFGGLSQSNQTCQVPNSSLVDPRYHWSSTIINFDDGKSMQAAPNTSIVASSLKDNVFLPCSSKEIRKRTFDLKLPGNEYIDREEERFRNGTVSGVSKVPDYAIKDLSAVCHLKDSKIPVCKDQLNPSEGNSSRTNFMPTITDLAEWNKTSLINQKGPLYSSSSLPLGTSIMAEPHLARSYAQMPNMVFQVQTKENARMQIGKDLEIHSEDLYLKKLSRQHEHTSSNHLMSPTKPFDTHASSSKNATSSIGNNSLNSICLSRNLTYNPRYQIDLNSYPIEDGSSQVEMEKRSMADINLEPPVSPQNKEASPPRGNSVEKQPADSVKLSEKDDKYQKDLALPAAEALVLISSNSAQCLKWFAEVVCYAENVLKEDETVQGRIAYSKHSELVADGFNNFAALTPVMEETKLGGYCSKSTGNKKRIAAATSSSPPKRKRTRRTKSQKTMQGDIQPHMTSPSMQEVPLENRTISWLRENESKARLGKKKSSKSEQKKGKKQNSEPTLQHLMCSYLKQQTADAKLDSLERRLPNWGRRNKRQTGHRRPASDHALRLAVLRLVA
ncbi:hypothetical protein ACET3Z_027210 [Daucus carota]